MKKIKVSLILAGALLAINVHAQSPLVSYAKDLVSGTHVRLTNGVNSTTVTNLANGESIIVEGELAGIVGDKEYTQIMKLKRQNRLTQAQDELSFKQPNAATNSNNHPRAIASLIATACPGNYSIMNSWESPTCYLGKSSDVSLTARAISQSPKSLTITLFQQVDWWTDKSLGSRDFQAHQQGNNLQATWNNVEAGKYYYLRFVTTYDGRAVWGQYSLVQ